MIPPNSEQTTDYCGTMKTRGITVAVLYIPYETIQDANSAFANNEDGYANNNIPNIPAALQACASPGFYYTASTPQAIQTALITDVPASLISASRVAVGTSRPAVRQTGPGNRSTRLKIGLKAITAA